MLATSTRTFSPIAAPPDHRTAVITTRVVSIAEGLDHVRETIRCSCGQVCKGRPQFVAHLNLVSLGVK